jgi:hypothetical protein
MADWFSETSDQFVPRELRNDGKQVEDRPCGNELQVRAEAFTQHCTFLHDVSALSEKPKEFHSPE